MSEQDWRGVRLEQKTFLLLVTLVTGLFAWLMLPYFGAILWGMVAAIVFSPLYRKLAAMLGGRRTLAATLTLLVLLGLVILPSMLVAVSLLQEAIGVYEQLQSGHIDVAEIVSRLRDALPLRVQNMIGTQLADPDRLREMLGSVLTSAVQSIAGRALLFGQGALSFLAALGIMLYLTFFLLRDGDIYGRSIKAAIPLNAGLRERLLADFVTVVRATMKGSVVVAIIQGVLGGVIFSLLGINGALLWGLLMGFFSLLPAVGRPRGPGARRPGPRHALGRPRRANAANPLPGGYRSAQGGTPARMGAAPRAPGTHAAGRRHGLRPYPTPQGA